MLLKSVLGVAAVLAIGSAGAYLVHRACSPDALTAPSPTAVQELKAGSCCPLSSKSAPSCCDDSPGCCPAESDGASCPAAKAETAPARPTAAESPGD
jgi:hypothetical protein